MNSGSMLGGFGSHTAGGAGGLGSFSPYAAPMAGLFGGLGSMLFNAGQDTPSEAADPYLRQVGPTATQQQGPYAQAGRDQIPILQKQYQDLLNNPEMLMQKFGNTFQQSPGYQWQKNQAIGAGNRAAAAGGMLGSPQSQQNIEQTVGQLANQDYYNYIGNVLGLYNKGLSGSENMFGTGAQSANSLSEQLTKALMGQASNAYEGQAAQNQQGGMDLGNILGSAAMLAFL